MKFYPLVGEIPMKYIHDHAAIKTGEYREPQKGEWFLSGAIAEAYRAPNNLSAKYYIAKIVKIKKVFTYEIVQ